MSHQAVSCGQTTPVTGADNKCLCGVQGGCWGQDVREVSEETETDGSGVEAGAVGTSAVPASSFVHLSGVANAEVVSDVSPSVRVHVEVLDVSHLSVAKCLSVASSTSGVMNNEMRWWLGCKPCWVSGAGSPGGSAANVGAGPGLGVNGDGQSGDQQGYEKFHLSVLEFDTRLMTTKRNGGFIVKDSDNIFIGTFCKMLSQ